MRARASSELALYLLGFQFVDGGVRKAVVMKEAHLLVEQTVNHMSSGVLPLHKADQVPIQSGAQVHGPVVAVQSHLDTQRFRVRTRAQQRWLLFTMPSSRNTFESKCLGRRKKTSFYVE